MMLSNDDVADILRLLDGLPFDEFDLQTSAFRLALRRDGQGEWSATHDVRSQPNITTETPTGDGDSDDGGGATSAMDDRAGLHAVRAPLVGTFYRAPRPGAAPFVDVGDDVEADTVVGIIETMKLFNSVEAGTAGEVVEFCIDNAAFADKGAVLLRIAPDPS